jgi:hypothetical protein
VRPVGLGQLQNSMTSLYPFLAKIEAVISTDDNIIPTETPPFIFQACLKHINFAFGFHGNDITTNRQN